MLAPKARDHAGGVRLGAAAERELYAAADVDQITVRKIRVRLLVVGVGNGAVEKVGPVIVDDRISQQRFQITFRRQVDGGLQVFSNLP